MACPISKSQTERFDSLYFCASGVSNAGRSISHTMQTQINAAIVWLDDLVWGRPLIILVMLVGVLLTVRLKGLQASRLPRALKLMFKNEADGKGEVTSFGALCTALSATIGTGNIVGVATAVVAGGPGALFWMIVAAFFGMATKYAEGLLAVKFRVVREDGHVLGGPFYYIENGMGKKWKWLAKLFAFFGAAAGLMGIGTITQVNGISSAVKNFFDPNDLHMAGVFGLQVSWSVIICGAIVTILAALVILGGLKRISGVAQVIVPFMAVLYVVFGLSLIILNITRLPQAVVEIVRGAFNPAAVTGGAVGSFMVAMQKGVARGIFSNESGLGSAPIAAAAARTKEPARQGLVSMTGTFLDTIVICAITGLCIVLTGAWDRGLQGVAVTTRAFQDGLPVSGEVTAFVLMVCLAFFAFTTILGWDYYSERCLEYLCNGNMAAVKVFRYLYLLMVFVGPYMTVAAVWNIADIFNGLMAFPNLVALLALNGVTVRETRDYFKRLKAGETE